jgi:hypothetical protein
MLKYLTFLVFSVVMETDFYFTTEPQQTEILKRKLVLDDFPTPEQLWEKYKKYKGIETPEAAEKLLRKTIILTEQTANQDTTNKLQ